MLRSINVGGRNRVADGRPARPGQLARVRRRCHLCPERERGLHRVRVPAPAVARAIEERIAADLGLGRARGGAEQAAAGPHAAGQPLSPIWTPTRRPIHVTFLAERPDTDRWSELEAQAGQFGADRFEVDRQRGLPPLSRWLRGDQAEQRLPRAASGRHRHHPQLAHGDHAGRDWPVSEPKRWPVTPGLGAGAADRWRSRRRCS